MPNIEALVREINRDLVPEFEKKLRAYLVAQDKDWLIEQVVRLTLDAHSLKEMDRKHIREQESRKRQERVERVRKLKLDSSNLQDFIDRYQDISREVLIRENLLSSGAPAKGGDLIAGEFRSPEGTALLQLAKDMLFGLLFGDESTNTHLHRTQRELLTLTIPSMKSDALDFMKATTELSAKGTWQDPNRAASDLRASNIVLEIEYGEVEGKAIGHGIITALKLINNLEINEEILYGRMEKIEQSTLVS